MSLDSDLGPGQDRPVLRDIVRALPANGFVLVGIDGRGGSGKTTLAERLAAEVGGVVVHGDDFYRPLPSAQRLALDAAQGYRQYFDWERLRDQVLQPLRSGGVSRHQHYDWGSGEVGGEHHEVAASGVVVVEGCYVARPELAHFYDVTVYVDTPSDVCLDRLRARRHDHGPEDWIGRWHAAEEFYLRTTSPWERLAISGTPR
jgi:uridine kinase